MIKIKAFEKKYTYEIDDEVNEFLKQDIKVLDIQMSSAGMTHSSYICVLIVYEQGTDGSKLVRPTKLQNAQPYEVPDTLEIPREG